MMKKLLETTGIDPKRLRMEWISASEGGRFANTIKEFTAQIKELGPGPFSQAQAEKGGKD